MIVIGALPVGEFAKNVDSAGGILGHIGVGVVQTPRAAAPEADYLTQGAIRREG